MTDIDKHIGDMIMASIYIKPREWEEIGDLIERMLEMANKENRTVKCRVFGEYIVVPPNADTHEVWLSWDNQCYLNNH